MNTIVAFFLALLVSFNGLGSPLGLWQVLDVQETKLGKNGLVVPLVILAPTKEIERQSVSSNAKKFLPPGEKFLFVVRLKQDQDFDIPLMVEGGKGIVSPTSARFAVQTIWPKEAISFLDDTQFAAMMNRLDENKTLIDKPGSEPKNTLNGGAFFDFERDVRVLTGSSTWRSLSRSVLEKAHYQIPSQTDRPERAWGCGPNSGARALTLIGHQVRDFNSFVDKCPKSWSLFADVGPTPTQLAQYMRETDNRYPIAPLFHEYFPSVLFQIKTSIDRNLPMIILLVRTTFSMHYVTIVGYNDAEKKIAIMDTTKIIYWIGYDDLEYWMNADGLFLSWFVSLSDYNGIIFYQS